jgi:hypothetical protein
VAGLENLTAILDDSEFPEASAAWATSVPDPIEFLKSKGYEVPAGADVTVTVSSKPNGQKEHCWQVCVHTPVGSVCYKRCSTS